MEKGFDLSIHFVQVLLIVLFLSFLYIGCEKEKTDDPSNPNIPQPYGLHVEITVGNDSVLAGDNVLFMWTSNANSLILTINQGNTQSLSTNGSKSFIVQVNSIFVFTFIKGDTSIAKTFDIVVTPPPNLPTLTVTASPDTIENGSTSSILVESDSDSISSDLPGFTGVPGTFPTPNLAESTVYHFTAFGEEGQTNANVSVTVMPLPTRYELFIFPSAWSPDSMWLKTYENDPWNFSPTSIEYRSQWYVFYTNGTYENFDPPDVWFGLWSFSEDQEYLILGDKWHFEEFSDTGFKIMAKVPHLGGNPDSTFVMESYKFHNL